MMPHLLDRPVSLVRAPGGVGGSLFYQKHAKTEKLPGIRHLAAALNPGHPPLLTVADHEGIVSPAQWNVIEFYTNNSKSDRLERPDRFVFDLDPGEGVAWRAIREAARLPQSLLKELRLAGFAKTSGGKGIHVVVPLPPKHSWEAAKGFSQAVARHLAATIPERFVAKSGACNRIGRIFVDYLRNGRDSTTLSALSARARPGLGVSVPFAWEELDEIRAANSGPWRTRASASLSATNRGPVTRAARGR